MDATEPDPCAALDPADCARLAEAAGILLDARGMVIRVSEWLAGRLNGFGRRVAGLGPHLLGEEWQAHYQGVIESALRNAYRVGIVGLGDVARPPRGRLTRLAAAASGSASGFIGLPGVVADLPVTTTLMMRAIAEIARAEGEDLAQADTRQACIEVFAFGGPELADDDIDVAYWTIRASLSHASIALVIRQAAARFGLMLSQKYLAQAVPLIGAAAGGTLNYVFMGYYQKMARVHFTLRDLERRNDPVLVRGCFETMLREARSRPLRPWARMPDHRLPPTGDSAWIGHNNRGSSAPAT
jgi:EcsC protein family